MHIGYFDRPVSGIPTFSRYLCLPGTGIFQEVRRLYGIGAALDPAGVRFSIVLLLIAYLLCENEDVKQAKWKVFVYLFAFL